MGKMRNAYKILVRKPEGKSPLRRPGHRRKDNTKVIFKGKEYGYANWIQLT
jgi:hypothetical protein